MLGRKMHSEAVVKRVPFKTEEDMADRVSGDPDHGGEQPDIPLADDDLDIQGVAYEETCTETDDENGELLFQRVCCSFCLQEPLLLSKQTAYLNKFIRFYQ